MSDITKDYSVAKNVVKAENAKLIGEVRYPMLDDLSEVTIFWPVSDYKLADLCLEYLTLRVSTANETGTGNTTDQQWMTEILNASLGTVDGSWRIINSSLAKHANTPGVSMVLRRGFITKGNAATAYDQLWALMPNDQLDAQIGKRQFMEYLAGIHPRQGESILDQLNSSALIENPVVNGQTLTGMFAPSNVVLTPNPEDGDLRIYRTMTEVTVITLIATLSALTPYRVRNNEILEAFDFETGEEDEFVLRYTNLSTGSRAACRDLTDVELVAIFTALDNTVSWTYITRRFIEQIDNTAHLEIMVKCVTWRSWTTNAVFASDYDSDKDAPEGNYDTRTRVWEKIRKADAATALADIVHSSTAVPTPSGYEITTAKITDKHDGSINVLQVIRKVLSNRASQDGDIQEQKTQNPFGWEPGTIDNLTTVYDGYDLADLPTTSTTPSGYTFLNRQDEPDGNWWKSMWIYGKVTWSGLWADAHQTERNGPTATTPADEGGSGTRETHYLPGVAQGDVDTTVAAAATPYTAGLPSGTTRVVTSISVSENTTTGEYIVSRKQAVAFTGTTADDALVTEVQFTNGRRQKGCTRVWWRRTAAAKDTLTTSGLATQAFTFNGTEYLANRFNVGDNGDTTFDVTQLGGYDSDAGDDGSGTWGETYNSYYTDRGGRLCQVWVFKKYFATAHGAELYVSTLNTIVDPDVGLEAHTAAAGWYVIHSDIDRHSNGLLFKATRMEILDLGKPA